MIQELATLCMSDIVRLLGTLVLLSLGITLTLWGLKRRRGGAVVMALFLCLVALVPAALAIELPPAGSVAFIQTTGPNGPLANGDWYTSRNPDAGGPGYHTFELYVPCAFPLTQMITVQLFDPESYDTGVGPEDDGDEVRPDDAAPDSTTFTLTNPSGGLVDVTTYPPDPTTSLTWTTFINFYPSDHGCGIYTLATTTSNDDENAWKLRVEPENPDGTSGTGDELSLGNLQTSFQHSALGCQTFYLIVPAGASSIRLRNFDMDNGGTINYTAPSGRVFTGTVSGGAVWNNSTSATYPPPEGPGGDGITGDDLEPGLWQAEICLGVQNQYIFDTGGIPYFYEAPPTPKMIVSKDDGTTTFYPGGVLTYTITYTNAGDGAALDAVLNDTLPLSTTFISCSGGLSCGYIPPPPGSGIVTFSLGTVDAGDSGSVTLTVRIDLDAPLGAITNTVELDYSDILFSDYPVITDTDVNQYEEPPPIPGIAIAKTPDLQTVVSGSTVTFTITVTNTGNVDLSNVTVSDAQAPNCAANLGSLAAGESTSYTCTLDNVTADFTNVASVTGTPPVGDDVSASDPADVDVIGPGIAIAKTPDLQTVVSGSTVTFTITVTNTGNVPLTNVTVTDPLAPDCARTFASLGPGASESYVCTVTNVTADFTNVATVTGTPPVGGDVTDSDPAEVDVIGLPTPTPTPTSEPSEPSEPEPPTPTPTPTSPTPVTPTPTVEVLTVERLPETGGFPGWFTVVLGVPLIIGAAGLLNLALLGMRGRWGDGKGD